MMSELGASKVCEVIYLWLVKVPGLEKIYPSGWKIGPLRCKNSQALLFLEIIFLFLDLDCQNLATLGFDNCPISEKKNSLSEKKLRLRFFLSQSNRFPAAQNIQFFWFFPASIWQRSIPTQNVKWISQQYFFHISGQVCCIFYIFQYLFQSGCYTWPCDTDNCNGASMAQISIIALGFGIISSFLN